MRHTVLLAALLPLLAFSQTAQEDAAIGKAQAAFFPDVAFAQDAEGRIRMDQVVEGELVERLVFSARDLDPHSVRCDTALQQIQFRCHVQRPRCIRSVQYRLDLEKQSSSGRVGHSGDPIQLEIAAQALVSLIQELNPVSNASETSSLLRRMRPEDHSPDP